MLAHQRREKILELLHEDGSAKVVSLSKIFKVTEALLKENPVVRLKILKLIKSIEGIEITATEKAYLIYMTNSEAVEVMKFLKETRKLEIYECYEVIKFLYKSFPKKLKTKV